ncbi:hypothetical protein SAMN05445756_1576 [Kytococcus aerolatus]|uniref:Uncharacterized protein n=1 Tax=Kytococcus aerolatus TaxID=592308 RepID=A0A212U0K7_9MICO|nr:hypothetical protein [Kytococcus aerolatus]SNC71666.1 hypothetical protein SAMN05445756_1576 [Kytococcus aerolatus]
MGVTSSDAVSPEEVDQLASDLEALFTDGMQQRPDGTFVIDRAGIIERFGPVEGGAIIHEFTKVARTDASSSQRDGLVHTAGTSYGECVLNYTGFGLIFGSAEGTILGYINRHAWKDAAEAMVKFLGRQAVKGGAVGLAASLAAGGAWCATPWSR